MQKIMHFVHNFYLVIKMHLVNRWGGLPSESATVCSVCRLMELLITTRSNALDCFTAVNDCANC